MNTSWQIWAVFWLATLALLALDLFGLHRKPHAVRLNEALFTSGVWILLALAFNGWIYLQKGPQAGLEFLTGYLVEKSLSVDNVFVFLVVFRTFRVPPAHQHKVLFYGVIGALVLRAAFVASGLALIRRFDSVVYVFGAILLVTGMRMALPQERVLRPEKNRMVRAARRLLPMTDDPAGARFLVRSQGRWIATPLLLALLTVEASDIIFALDSVPAVIAITKDLFIVYTSNAFAILGLRALYFVLAELLPHIQYLHHGLAAILIFVGLKMITSSVFPISAPVSLAVVTGILFLTGLASWLRSHFHRGDSGRTWQG